MNACVHRLDLGLYSHPKEFFWGMEFEPMLTPRENPLYRTMSPEEGSNPRCCGQRAQALPTELFRPPVVLMIMMVKRITVMHIMFMMIAMLILMIMMAMLITKTTATMMTSMIVVCEDDDDHDKEDTGDDNDG